MIGGEAAELAALECHPVWDDAMADDRDPYDLGWVMDWLYGDAALPPLPLPRDVVPTLPGRRRVDPVHAAAAEPAPEAVRGGRGKRRRVRQLALL